MKVSFQADNDLDQRIVAAILRIEPTINFQTAVELNLHGLDDLSVLALAAFEGRILVSHDQSTMPGLFRRICIKQYKRGSFDCSANFIFGKGCRRAFDDLVSI